MIGDVDVIGTPISAAATERAGLGEIHEIRAVVTPPPSAPPRRHNAIIASTVSPLHQSISAPPSLAPDRAATADSAIPQ
ncbi:hypothetical protein [Bradyrhizobium cosmicum]|uniref:hypothetical protein n=1 Tax=Bradyrhizobium cosmicum TaxID=1404864 RepID=UPI0028E28510|nr:hypothetical protein [Bradyrhizobium cosmicum]